MLILFRFRTAYQVGQLQVLKNDDLMVFHKLLRLLVVKIAALVGSLAMGFCSCLACFLTPMTAAFLAGYCLLTEEDDVPVACFILDGAGLGSAVDVSVELELDASDLGEADTVITRYRESPCLRIGQELLGLCAP
jgi:hypothetical protein